MSKMIYVNLPVADLARATAFYESVGAEKNPMFCDDTASCMVFSETINVMLLTHDKFMMYSPKPVADSAKVAEVLNCLSAESRADCDVMAEAAQAAGGRPDPSPRQDHGFMYSRGFADLDGHIWNVLWMDLEALKVAMGKA